MENNKILILIVENNKIHSMTLQENLRNDGFDHNVFNLLPDQSGVYSPRTEILPQGLQSPEKIKHTHTNIHFVGVGIHMLREHTVHTDVIVAKNL